MQVRVFLLIQSSTVAIVCVLARPPVKVRRNTRIQTAIPVVTLNIFFPHTESQDSANGRRLD